MTESNYIISHRGGAELIEGKYAAFLEIKNHPVHTGYWRSINRFETEKEALDYLEGTLLKAGYSFSLQRFRNPWVLELKFERLAVSDKEKEKPEKPLEKSLDGSADGITDAVEEPEKIKA